MPVNSVCGLNFPVFRARVHYQLNTKHYAEYIEQDVNNDEAILTKIDRIHA
ncbi:conserved protein of unknown function [Enterobacter cancerogenus]|nr:hypothetical protein ENTCAN_05824 [Enterobacter cancerogenus ATCC 35316]CAD5354887.1 conserved protein of unknown function [Enterobacter cancerogenus]